MSCMKGLMFVIKSSTEYNINFMYKKRQANQASVQDSNICFNALDLMVQTLFAVKKVNFP